jgi:diguanylate cyclase (GGDEF)-like protein
MAHAPTQVPLVVLTGRQDDVELINRTLRDAGHAVHCHWVRTLDDLPAALERHRPQLLWLFADGLAAEIRDVAKIKQQHASIVPIIVVRATVDEAGIADALLSGAHDLVSNARTDRLCSVAEREMRAFRLEHALNETLSSASQYKRQLKAFVAGSVDAIAHVQEGILVDANKAFAELFGQMEPAELLGPLMDQFDASSQAALKGALIACTKGQWHGDALKVVARIADGSTLPLSLQLEETSFDGEPAVKLSVPRAQAPATDPEELVEQAVSKDPSTGFYHRRRFLELLTDRLDTPAASGVRALAYIRPDKFGTLEDRVGAIGGEDVLVQIADTLRDLAQPHDLYGRFGGQVFVMLLERGTIRDAVVWAENAVERLAARIYEVGHTTTSVTCTIGLAEVGPATDRMDTLIAAARAANKEGRTKGGSRVVFEETTEESTRVQRFDEIWVQQIKSALMENRFKLAHLPIASLSGARHIMFDTLIRLIDAQGDELPAAEFMPAAARNRLLRSIDRWVIGASLTFCSLNAVDRIFIKLSKESIIDKTLGEWLVKAVDGSGVPPGKLCFEASEADVVRHLVQTQALATELRARGYAFAVEHFGVSSDSSRVLEQIPMDYVKIDGSLMQTLAAKPALQDKVRGFIQSATRHSIATIAERVEDANTMAVLFQLGVAYMQGHYVHEPDVVLAEAY